MKTLLDLNLNALRIAESAARTGSFVRAAEEQHLTASAVSHRIKALETQLKFQLFVRGKNSVVLTPDGQNFLREVREGLGRIVSAKQLLANAGRKMSLRLRLLPTFALRWLIPRLPDFQMRWPSIHLDIATSYDLPDLVGQVFDVGIYYGDGNFPQMRSRELFREDLIPVCSPGLPSSIGISAETLRIEDLQHFTLLHSDTCTPNWTSWLTFAEVPDVASAAASINFDSCMLTYDAAVAGLGFACANRAYVADDIAAGRLIAPFQIRQPNTNGWHLLYPEHGSIKREVAVFEDWILDQVAGSKSCASEAKRAAAR